MACDLNGLIINTMQATSYSKSICRNTETDTVG